MKNGHIAETLERIGGDVGLQHQWGKNGQIGTYDVTRGGRVVGRVGKTRRGWGVVAHGGVVIPSHDLETAIRGVLPGRVSD